MFQAQSFAKLPVTSGSVSRSLGITRKPRQNGNHNILTETLQVLIAPEGGGGKDSNNSCNMSRLLLLHSFEPPS